MCTSSYYNYTTVQCFYFSTLKKKDKKPKQKQSNCINTYSFVRVLYFIFIAKPRSKSASNTSRSVTPITNQSHNKLQPQSIVQHATTKRDNPKINLVSTTVNISYQHQQQSKPQQQNNIPESNNDYINKPPTGRQQQYTVINTGMHTNEM